MRDAATCITKLPKRQHETFAWRTAIEALMLVAEYGGDTLLPRIGVMRALYPGDNTEPIPRKKAARKYRIVSEHQPTEPSSTPLSIRPT